ncbi:MAG: hypothetical protein JWP66_1082 [Naasia sp.]|nr:hypothetical protein [Naasia sp.]
MGARQGVGNDASGWHARRMRRLFYAGGHIVVDDRTCKAVLRYARALAIAGRADVAMVPIALEGGGSAYAHLLIGPASEIYSVPIIGPDDEPYDESMILALEAKTRDMHPSVPSWPEEMTDIPELDFELDFASTDGEPG